MNFKAIDNEQFAKIKVIGVGGAGGNAVANMINAKLQGIKFVVANTDAQALESSQAPKKIQLGEALTQGLGAGANPEIGEKAALESKEDIRTALGDNLHMVFITAGFGGGTGTGAAPVIAEICKELGILTVAVVSKPFAFEGSKRMAQAEMGIEKLKGVADTVITIPNNKLISLASKNATLVEMFKKADEVLLHSVKGITDLIIKPGTVNLDFADVKTTMSKAGMAIMGIGEASGDNRAIQAAQQAISHPLLDDVAINGAKAVLINITSTDSLTMLETNEASDFIYKQVGEEAEIIWGTAIDENMGDRISVTVIATGINPVNYRNKEVKPTRENIKNTISERINNIEVDNLENVDFDEPTYIRINKNSSISRNKYIDDVERVRNGRVNPVFLKKVVN